MICISPVYSMCIACNVEKIFNLIISTTNWLQISRNHPKSFSAFVYYLIYVFSMNSTYTLAIHFFPLIFRILYIIGNLSLAKDNNQMAIGGKLFRFCAIPEVFPENRSLSILPKVIWLKWIKSRWTKQYIGQCLSVQLLSSLVTFDNEFF